MPYNSRPVLTPEDHSRLKVLLRTSDPDTAMDLRLLTYMAMERTSVRSVAVAHNVSRDRLRRIKRDFDQGGLAALTSGPLPRFMNKRKARDIVAFIAQNPEASQRSLEKRFRIHRDSIPRVIAWGRGQGLVDSLPLRPLHGSSSPSRP